MSDLDQIAINDMKHELCDISPCRTHRVHKVIMDFTEGESMQSLTHEELCDIVANMAATMVLEEDQANA